MGLITGQSVFATNFHSGYPMAQSQSLGRPRKHKEPLNARFPVNFTQTMLKAIGEKAALDDKEMGEFIRDAVMDFVNPPPTPEPPHWSEQGTDQYRAPLLMGLPCGPWKEGLESDQTLSLSKDVHVFLEILDGDIFATTAGDSMEGAGILDGDVVVLRPLAGKTPRRGEIVQVNIRTEGGENVSTLKRWDGLKGNIPNLLDGNDQDYALPEGAIEVTPMARAVARFGRL